MKPLIITSLVLFLSFNMRSQCATPPPPGLSPIYSIDLDNDGFTTFDVGYYIENFHRPGMEDSYGVSSSGYDVQHYGSDGQITGTLYNNIELNEFGSIHYVYSGSGPTFDPQPPCYWPVYMQYGTWLIAVPFDGDYDGDGVLNAAEDSNQNLNLMDDDDDNDGIINYMDTDVLGTIAFKELQVQILPNPVGDGILTLSAEFTIDYISAYDMQGREVFRKSKPGNQLEIGDWPAGIYIFKIESDSNSTWRKLVVQ